MMGVLTDFVLRKIADRFGLGGSEVETRTAWPPMWWPQSSWLGGGVDGGRVVNPRTSENLSTVLACVSAISSAISSLPAFVYRLTDEGRNEDPGHPLSRLIRNGPNSKQTWPDFIEWLMASTLLRGNGLVEIETDGGGRVTELVPIPWEYVCVQLLPNGRLAYDITPTTYLYGGPTGGPRRRLLEGEVLHLKDRSDDGLIGRSRLSRAAAVISGALAIQEFSGALYENSANPSGVLQAEGKMSEAQLQRLADHFRATFSGPSKAAKALILDQGLEWKSVSISPEDAELLASRRFTGEELARLYNVPPPIIGDLTHGTFTNSETLIRFFAQSTLSGWCRKLESEMHRSVLSESSRLDRQFVLDLSGLLRGDPETRWKSHEIALRNQVLTPNEIRGEEGWNPRPGGDEVIAPRAPGFGAA
jgi:HK97 family phage portal protein